MGKEPEFSNLILLVGTNPLPNYVVADYFLQKKPRLENIWLIHSEESNLQGGTHEQSQNLTRILAEKWDGRDLRFVHVPLSDVSHAITIRRELKAKLISKIGHNASYHLNYTGGTKSMSTHVYFILHETKELGQGSYSYLDARNYRLVDDQSDDVIETDLRRKVVIPFEKLIALHGFRKYPDKKEKNRNCAYDEKFDRFMRQHNGGLAEGEKITEGIWFEEYIADKLRRSYQKNCEDIEIVTGCRMKHPNWSQNIFEMDILIVNGYHLTGISCTITDKKGKCKQKGFEAILRTRQIGGEETKTALFTGLKSKEIDGLKEELSIDTGAPTDNLLVFGPQDMENEEDYIEEVRKLVFS